MGQCPNCFRTTLQPSQNKSTLIATQPCGASRPPSNFATLVVTCSSVFLHRHHAAIGSSTAASALTRYPQSVTSAQTMNRRLFSRSKVFWFTPTDGLVCWFCCVTAVKGSRWHSSRIMCERPDEEQSTVCVHRGLDRPVFAKSHRSSSHSGSFASTSAPPPPRAEQCREPVVWDEP